MQYHLPDSLLVALLLIATARSLDDHPVRVLGPVSTTTDQPASTPAADHSARWSTGITTLKVSASLHPSFLEQPERVADLLSDFLSEVERQ
jgi:hypothetical protein